ncbi:O-antigen ligase family protein [Ornithinibacillus scapharcae]|uniref:O-antigen ligase family protein n=1 Tax=Ornithinibacillus scapharcae TaxID=1147159 RepID=UPI000225B2D4|nr:O-antigen ligase family protein [Ornithinibacillus scapharcae]
MLNACFNQEDGLFLIGLIVFCLPFMFHLTMIIELNVSFSDLLMVLMLFWLIAHKQNRDIIAAAMRRYHLMVLYIGFLIYGCIFSMFNYFTNIIIDFPYGVSAILKLSVNFAYVIVFLTLIEKYRDELLAHIFRWWKIAAVIISLLCILSVILYQLGIDTVLTLGGRAQATLNDPNLAALYLIVSMTIIAVSRIRTGRNILLNLPMAIVLLALVLTASRGGILSTILSITSVLLLSVLSARVKEILLFAGLALLFATGFIWLYHSSDVLSFAVERVATIGIEGDGTSYRVFLWNSAIEMWTHNPFIGVGIGQFISYSPEVFGYALSNIPHNTYLSFLTETGIVGFLAFIWFPAFLLTRLVIGLLTSREQHYFYLLIGLIAIAIQAISINIENIRFIWLFLMLAYVLDKKLIQRQMT